MPERDVEVYFQDGEWRIGVPKDEDPISTHGSKDEAVDAGRAEAQRRDVELVIRNEDGTITDRDSELGESGDLPG